MPPEGCSHDRGHKHPFTVSELFAQEVSQINDLFFTALPEDSKKATTINNLKKEESTPEKYDNVKHISSSSSSDKSDEEDSSSSEEVKNI